jgi:hypothetical protein
VLLQRLCPGFMMALAGSANAAVIQYTDTGEELLSQDDNVFGPIEGSCLRVEGTGRVPIP